jgi:hypothetical protein
MAGDKEMLGFMDHQVLWFSILKINIVTCTSALEKGDMVFSSLMKVSSFNTLNKDVIFVHS